MGLEKVTSAVTAALSHFSISSSSSGTSVSSSELRPLSSPFRSPWSGNGRAGVLRHATSLQDFSSYRRFASEEPDLFLGTGGGIGRTKATLLSPVTGGGNSFSKEKSLLLPPSRSQYWLKLAMVLFIILTVFILSVFLFMWLKSFANDEMPQYSIVLDCGSTGTRVYVYEWIQNSGKDQGNLPLLLHPFPEGADPKSKNSNGRAYHRTETEPGLDKLLHNGSALRAALEPLLHWASNKIPSQAHRKSPLFLFATAGLRRLPRSDSEWILEKAWSVIKESTFMCQRDWVKIITGVEEAYYGWVALNYITNKFGKVPREETLGALDLGGSSLQVTFEPKGLKQDEFSLNLSIGRMEHHIDAYSLAGYGLNDAFEKSILLLLKSKPSQTHVKFSDGILHVSHPCLQSGYKKKYACSKCSSILEGGSPLVAGHDIDHQKVNSIIKLIGAPNWDECEALALSTVNSSEWSQKGDGVDCKHSSCAIADNQPQPQGQFYAMSGFYVVYNFFNLTSEASFQEVLMKGREFCTKTWKDAQKSVVPQPFIEQYCFRAPYVVSLLQYGLHLNDKQVIVGSGSITWTLGAAFMEAGSLFLKTKKPQPPLALFTKSNFGLDTTLLKAGILFLILIIALCAFRKGIWKAWQRPHLPLFGNHSSGGTPVKFGSNFRFQMRNPASNGVSPGRPDVRAKVPLVSSGFQQPFGIGQAALTGSTQLLDPFTQQSTSSVGLSFSSGNLGQLQHDNGVSRSPLRGQTRLQSRRSQSREDLCLSIAESHIVKL